MEIDAAFSSNISDFEPDGIVGGDMDTKSLDRSVASSPFLSSNSEKRKLLKKRAGTNYKIARLKLEETGLSIIDFTHLEGRALSSVDFQIVFSILVSKGHFSLQKTKSPPPTLFWSLWVPKIDV